MNRRHEHRLNRKCRDNKHTVLPTRLGWLRQLTARNWTVFGCPRRVGSIGRLSMTTVDDPLPFALPTPLNDTKDTQGDARQERTRRRRRDRESKETKETQDSAQVACVGTLLDAVRISLDKRINKDTLFLFWRALLAFEIKVGAKIPESELDIIFNQWWAVAKPKLPKDADYNLYLAKFTYLFRRVKVPLKVDPLEEAMQYAAMNEPPKELGPIVGRVYLMCEKLKSMSNDGSFYISFRTIGKALDMRGNYDPGAIMSELERRGIIRMIQKGTGRQSNRYRWVKI